VSELEKDGWCDFCQQLVNDDVDDQPAENAMPDILLTQLRVTTAICQLEDFLRQRGKESH